MCSSDDPRVRDRCTAKDLKAGGFDATELRAVGFTVEELKPAGFKGKELRAAGYNARELGFAGFSGGQLKEAGFSARDVRGTGSARLVALAVRLRLFGAWARRAFCCTRLSSGPPR